MSVTADAKSTSRLRRAWSKASAVVAQETATVSPRLVMAETLLGLLPRIAFNRVRVRILRAVGFQIGAGTVIMGRIVFTGRRNPAATVTIGDNSTINFGCVFDAAANIEVGDNVGIGQQVMIMTNRHVIGPAGQRLGPLEALPVRVEDGAWLSTRAVVLPGVTIGRGAVVAAGAVVTRSVAPHTLVAGVPARPIRDLPS